MRRILLFAVITGLVLPALALAAPTPTGFDTVASEYETIRQALVTDALTGVSPATQRLQAAVEALGSKPTAASLGVPVAKVASVTALLPELRQAAGALGNAKDLKAARDGFSRLSTPLIRWREAVGSGPAVAFCSMAKRSWLQPQGKPMGNPYLGKAMASCGQITQPASIGPPARRQPARAAASTAAVYSGDRAEAERFLAYERRIQLSASQEAVRVEALAALPAPCCKQFSAATCCCKCNMARATWGLAKHLIAEQGANATQVRAAVVAWHRAINPSGFTGDACFNGGCTRPFAKNGCGGMEEGHLVS